MAKFDVLIYGTVPECLEIEAANQEQAIAKATSEVLDRLIFEGYPAREQAGKTKQKRVKCEAPR